jgi:hypothetical protein
MTLIMLSKLVNDEYGYAWPKYEYLARECGCSVSTAKRHVEWLIEHGLIKREKQIRNGRQTTNRYHINVNVMIFQGCQSDTARGVNLTRQGCQSDTPSIELQDTSTDKSICGEPQPESDMKLNEVLPGGKPPGKSEDEILAAFNCTPKGCADFWRDMRSLHDNGFQAELLQKEMKMLKTVADRVGVDNFKVAVKHCTENWLGFTKHAEEYSTAFDSPLNPNVSYFVKFIEAAVGYANEQENPDTFEQVKPKALTKQPQKVQTKKAAMSPEEWLAWADRRVLPRPVARGYLCGRKTGRYP